MENKRLFIDADHILHLVASEGPTSHLGGNVLTVKPDMKALKRKFLSIVKEYEDSAAVEYICEAWKIKKKTILVFSDPDHNFRHDIFPGYKAGRPKRSETFYRLRRWAHRLGNAKIAKNCEADDYVAAYVRAGGLGVSTDKDLLKGVPGYWYNPHFMAKAFHVTTKKEADHFTLLQTLAGDSTDKIPGIPRVGLKTAENLLKSNGESWEGVVKAYINAGLTEEDAILTRRLVGMDQYIPKRGIKLWQPKK